MRAFRCRRRVRQRQPERVVLDQSLVVVEPGEDRRRLFGEAAQGLLTTLHYADGLNTPRDNAFRLSYAKMFKMQPDVYAVQGYDAAQMLAAGLGAVKGAAEDLANQMKTLASMVFRTIVASKITPVPGGVGPMTIAMLMSNTVKAARLSSSAS